MNEEALKDSYNLFVSEGYNGSMEEFLSLLSSNPEALKDSYSLFQREGYEQPIEDYEALMGVKKKELVSPSGDGFSEQPIPAKSEEFTIDGNAVTQNEFEDYSNKMQAKAESEKAVSSTIDSTLEIPEEPKQEEFTDPITTELIDQEEEFVVPQLNYQYKDQGFVFEQSSLLGDAMTVTSANGKTIDVDLDVFSDSSKTEEANKLKIFLSENKLESKTLKSREFGYQENKQKFQNEKEITKVVKLINKDADVLSKRIQVYLEENSKVDQELKAISLLSSQQKIDQKNRIDQVVLRKKELDNIKLNLIRSEKNIRYRDKELQESAGKYFTMKSSQGTWGGGLSNAILDGSARIGAGLANIATDVFTYFTPLESLMGKENYQKDFLLEAEKLNLGKPNEDQSIDDWIGSIDDDQVNKINKKIRDDARKQVKYATVYYEDGVKKYRTPEEAKGLGLLDIQRTALREIAGDPATTVEWTDLKKQGFWGGALLGVAESLPAMLGAPGAAGWAQRTAQMYGQVSDYLTQEMQGDTDFNEISEAEKAAITVPIGIVVASLEAAGLRNVLRQKGFLNSILLKVLKKTPRNVKGVSFQQLVREEVDNAISRGVLVITAAGAAEFETGFAQEIADITGKMVYNKLKEKEMFTTPESLADAFAQVLRAGAQEAVGGFILGVPGAMNAATTKRSYAQIDDDTFQMFESIKNDPEYTSMYVTDIKNKILKGELTKEEGEKQISDFQDLVGLANKIPNDLSVTQKKQSLVLLKRKQELERRTEGKDASLVKKDLDEINSINTQLENIRFDKEAEVKREAIPDMEQKDDSVKQIIVEDPNQAFSFEYESEKDIPDALKGVEPKGVGSIEIDGKKKIRLTYSGQQLLDAGIASLPQTQENNLTEDQQDIDSFFGEQTEETTETVESNLSINRAGEIVEQTSDELSTEATVISIAKKAAKAISKLLPNTRIVLHQNNQEFEKYARPGRAEIIGDTIHVNLSKAIATTVPHEIFHAVFLNKIKTDPRAAEVAEIMMKSVRKTLPNDSELARRIDTFAESYKDVSELQNEERLAELIGIMASEYQTLTKPQKNIVIKFIEDLARTLGVDINLTEFTKTDNDVIDLLNTLSTKVATGEEITEGDVEILEDGTNPVGDPTEIRVPKPRQQIEFEESYPLSLVTPDKRIDIISLVKDINTKKQKVWFWVADQLGLGDFQGIQLDAGPSYAFDGEAVWASSKSSKSIDKNINKADYLFIISGSPERSLLFNKKVYDVFIGKLGDFDTFKEDALATNPTKAVREILNNFDSWEALRDSPQRKAFLNAIVDQQGKPNTEFHKFIKSKDGFINTNDMRDGFYKANDFNINDVMVVIKPTTARDGSQHSTYDNEVLGEVLGVPDVKVNAFDIMPQEMVDKYKKQLTQQEKSQVVAPYGSGIRDVSPRQRRQQRTIEQVAQQYNMDNQGFIPKTANLSQLRKAVAPFGLEARQARVDQFGRGGGLFLVRNGRKFNPFAQTTRRQQRTTEDYIREGREAGFRDELIIDYLRRVRKLKVKEIKDLMDIDSELLGALPESFKNIKKGAIAGLKLFLRVEAFILKENRLNTQRKKKLTDAKIMDKAIEFLEKQPEYKNEADTFKVKKETKARKTLSTQQALMLSDLQKTLNQRPTKDIALKIRIARAMVRNRSKGERDLQKIKRELRNFMRKTLPASVYTKSEAMNLLKKIESATSKNIENLMDEVILLATTKNNIALQKKIDNLLNGKYETMVSGRRKGIKIDSGTRDRINVIKKTLVNSTATAEEIDKINQSLTEQFQDLAKDPTPDENVFNKMADLQIAINLNNALQMDDANLFKTVALDEAVQNLVGLVEGGRTLLRVILEKQAKQYRDQFSEVYYDVTGVKVDMESGDADSILKKQKSNRENKKIRDNVTKRVSKAIAGVANSIENQIFGTAEALDGLMDRISSLPGEMFGGRTEVLVTKRVDESSRNYKERKLGFEAVLQDKLMNLYGKNWKKISRKNRQPILTGIYRDLKAVEKAKKAFEENPTNKTKANYTKLKEENEEVLSQNQMYYLYNQYKDPSNKEAFDEMYDGDSARIMKEVEAKLDKRVKDFADWQVNEFFPAMYPYYNKVYKEIYRTNMPWNEFYAGRIYREGVTPEELDLLGDKSVFRTSVGSASTKSRVNSKLPIQKMDGTDALISYVNDMEYFAAYAETIRDINKLFTNQYLKAAIKNLHGDKTFTYIQKAIQKIANKGVRSEAYASFINGMNTVFILSRLGLSPVIMIKQLTSIFTYANDIGIRNWIKYSYKNLSELKSLWGEVRDNSVYMQDRKNNSILRQIESYSETGMKSFVPTPAKDFVVNFLMWTTKFGDRTAIMLGGLANYSYYKEQALAQGKTEKQAIDIAIVKFEKDTKRTQQSADLQDKDLYQTTNPVVRSLNMFLTTPKQYLRKEIQAVRGLSRKIAARDLKAGKGTLKENLRTLAMYHIFMPVIFQYISMGLPGLLRGWRDDDDDDLVRAAIIGNINALFILGEMVTMAGDFFTGKPWAGQTKSLGALTVAQSLTQKALKAAKTKDPAKRADAWQDFQLELMTIVGVPGAQLKKFVENYSKVLDSKDMGESILRLLNFSNYQISGREKKQSAKKQMTKREMEMLMPGMYEEIKELEGGELEDLQNELKQMEKDMLNELYK